MVGVSTPGPNLVANLVELDQQIAQAKDTTTDPSSRPKDRVEALLDYAALKSTQANAERLLRLCTK